MVELQKSIVEYVVLHNIEVLWKCFTFQAPFYLFIYQVPFCFVLFRGLE